ncbi:HpnM family protein [Acidithiobacillus sp.]|uniref:HpnM family protein n=1 Tax=Acidithiobacillus sp. TaxID=1872118 RepID=UPI0025C40DCF|nr:HpnM family protein [Acidithiobacillus sp.]
MQRNGFGTHIGVVLLALIVVPISGMAADSGSSAAAPKSESAGPAQRSPDAAIQSLDAALLKSMQMGKSAGYSGRYQALAPVLSKVFNFERIAELTLGPDWQKLSAAQQKTFVEVLREYTLATYAGRFDSYDGERFAIVQTQAFQPGTVGVYATLTERNGKVHRFDYLLQKDGDDWRIVNVVADGVSDLALKRAEYTETLRKKGFEALIQHLKKQIAAYRDGAKQ